jgi:hypothetical protein
MSWYKVERGWLDNPFFQDSPYSERDAWQWMIGEAAFEECRISVNGKPFALGKGQLYSSIRFMAQKFQWSTGRVARFLERLKEWGMVDTAVDTGQNLITICNYAKYQDRKSGADTAVDTAPHTPSDTAAEHQRIQTISPSRHSSTKEVADDGRDRIAELTGWADDPNWMGNFSRLKAWSEAGYDLEMDVIPTITRVMSKRTDPPSTLNYFDRAIADAYATRTKPLPEGKAHATHNPRKSATDASFAGFAQAVRLREADRNRRSDLDSPAECDPSGA